MFVTTHYLDEAEHCDRLALIHAGPAGRARHRGRAEGGLRRPRRAGGGRAARRRRPWSALDGAAAGCSRPRVFGTRLHVVVRRRRGGRAPRRWTLLEAAGNAPGRGRAHRALARGRLHPPRRGGGGAARGPRAAHEEDLGRRAGRSCASPRAIPLSLVMLLGLPAFMLVLYGFALNFDVRHVRPGRAGPRQERGQPRAGRLVRATRPTSTWWPCPTAGRRPRAAHRARARPRPCW